ncbi:MAG TPA: hypothetical protein GXX34_06515 [Clostridia bacterium]|nr:hypothetical protein [Clostridia bacterium]
MPSFIIELADIMPRHQALCGSKASNLGVVARKSRTAPGFCLMTSAYFLALRQAGLQAQVIELANSVSEADPGELEQAARRIQSLIRGIGIPAEVEEELRQGYDKLVGGKKGVKVAVRSSATAEDLPGASFAGQLESYLNLETWEQVREAVVACWASLWSPRVMHYRLRKRLAHDQVGMAVIIQKMVPARVSGVMFTANPVTQSRREIYIEAVPGLAEQLVQGRAAGEVYIFDKEKNFVSSRRFHGDYPLLTDFALRQLAHEGKKLEYLLEDYQDIEWAFYNDELYILQTRPITTLGEEEFQLPRSEGMTPIQREILVNIQERFPEPVLPLDAVVAKIYYLSLFNAYLELGFHVPGVDWRKTEQGIFPEHFVPPAIKPGLKRVFSLGKMLAGDLMQDWQYNEAAFDKYVQLMQQDMLKSFPMEIVLQYLEDGLRDFQRANTFRYLLYIQYGFVYRWLGRLLRWLYGRAGQEIFEDIVVGQPQATLAINGLLHQIAAAVREQPALLEFVLAHAPEEIAAGIGRLPNAEPVLSLFGTLMDEYGHREVSQGLGGIAAATWRDRPEVVWAMIKSLVRQGPAASQPEDAQMTRRQEAEAKLDKLASSGWGRILPLRRIFDRMVDYSRRYTAFREDSHVYLTQAMLVFRTLFLAIGRQLTAKGYLQEAQDIMYLTYWEVRDLVQELYSLREVSRRALEEKIRRRKLEYEARKKRWSQAAGAEVPASSEVLKGMGASRGQATGPCRVIRQPEELDRLQPGDILVAASTNPAWTPVFPMLAGLIVEHGSPLSHAAIIAREYGIPAVLGIKGATRLLRDGEQVSIDGSEGLVYRL